jgi:hypothetical protein
LFRWEVIDIGRTAFIGAALGEFVITVRIIGVFYEFFWNLPFFPFFIHINPKA